MQKVEVFTGVAVPFRRSNVDTDQIIPAVYLKRITKTGFEDALFASWRADKDFVLNQPIYTGAEVLIAGPDVLRFLPPLNITEKELNKGLLRLRNALRKFKDGFTPAAPAA
jgi:hypothetical protein